MFIHKIKENNADALLYLIFHWMNYVWRMGMFAVPTCIRHTQGICERPQAPTELTQIIADKG